MCVCVWRDMVHEAFEDATAFNGAVSSWDVSSVTNLELSKWWCVVCWDVCVCGLVVV